MENQRSYDDVQRQVEEQLRKERYKMERNLFSGIPSISNAYAESQHDYSKYVAARAALYGLPNPIASSAPYTVATEDMDPDEIRKLKVRAALRIAGGEELISIAVRKDDGSIDTRPAG